MLQTGLGLRTFNVAINGTNNAGGPSHLDPTGVFWNGDTGADKGISYSAGVTISTR